MMKDKLMPKSMKKPFDSRSKNVHVSPLDSRESIEWSTRMMLIFTTFRRILEH
jgi:hypothetical protein